MNAGRATVVTLVTSRPFASLSVVLVVAFLVRLSVVLLFAVEPRNDLLWNDAVGLNLARGHGFTASLQEPRVPGIFRTPGYPLFLAGVYSAFGHSHHAVYVTQALVDAVSALLVGAIALPLAGTSTALFAATLYAVYPYAAFFCGVLHQDILLVFATLVVLLVLVRASRSGAGLAAWLVVGIATGLTALVKANFVLLTALPLCNIWLGDPRPRRRAVATVALLVGTTVAVAPWILRNYLVFDSFTPLAVGGTGTNLKLLVDMLRHGEDHVLSRTSTFETDANRYLATFVDGDALIATERKLAEDAGAELLRLWPQYLLLILYHLPRLWISLHAPTYTSTLALAAFVLSWPVLLLGILGMWLTRGAWRHTLPLYATVIIITVMYAPYTPEARYTLPARPAMLIFVACALLWLARLVRRAASRAVPDH